MKQIVECNLTIIINISIILIVLLHYSTTSSQLIKNANIKEKLQESDNKNTVVDGGFKEGEEK